MKRLPHPISQGHELDVGKVVSNFKTKIKKLSGIADTLVKEQGNFGKQLEEIPNQADAKAIITVGHELYLGLAYEATQKIIEFVNIESKTEPLGDLWHASLELVKRKEYWLLYLAPYKDIGIKKREVAYDDQKNILKDIFIRIDRDKLSGLKLNMIAITTSLQENENIKNILKGYADPEIISIPDSLGINDEIDVTVAYSIINVLFAYQLAKNLKSGIFFEERAVPIFLARTQEYKTERRRLDSLIIRFSSILSSQASELRSRISYLERENKFLKELWSNWGFLIFIGMIIAFALIVSLLPDEWCVEKIPFLADSTVRVSVAVILATVATAFLLIIYTRRQEIKEDLRKLRGKIKWR